MKLNEANFDQILRRYLNGEATKNETDFLHAYYNAFEQSAGFTDQLSAEEKSLLENQIKNRLSQNIDAFEPDKKFNFKFLKYAAAIFVAVALIGSYYAYTGFNKSKNTSTETIAKDNPAKRADVMLKLADGTEVNLENEALAQTISQAGATINSEKHGELQYKNTLGQPADERLYNEVSIPSRKQFKITLGDGTNVWLNATSSLKYPVTFKASERRVYLTGEAYFEVSKDKSRPFIVQSKESQIVVTGTQFNVAAYADKTEVKTTLVEGSVRVSYANKEINLVPGEESVSNLANVPIVKGRADIETATAWKSGYFVFNQPLKEVMEVLSRWYGTKVLMGNEIENSTVAGKFSRQREIGQILTYIGELKGFTYTVDGKNIILKKI